MYPYDPLKKFKGPIWDPSLNPTHFAILMKWKAGLRSTHAEGTVGGLSALHPWLGDEGYGCET